MIPIVTPARMGEIDAAASVGVDVLVERAGAAVARHALAVLGGAYGRTVHVVAGPGNNGADGRVAARRLAERGVRTTVHDATAPPAALAPADLVIDAAFGTGFRGEWHPPDVGATPVLAVDVPTGLDARSGTARPGTWRAVRTVTFGALKPGQLFGDGPDHVGRLELVDIGLDASDPGTEGAWLLTADDVAAWLPVRARDAHKWSAAVRLVAGSAGMTGAAHLAAAAAQRTGSGLVAVSSPGIDPDLPIEAVGRPIPAADWADIVLADLHRFGALAIGPGLGRVDAAATDAARVVSEAIVPVVVDGDGLFALTWNEHGTPAFLRERDTPTVLTPHDGEYFQLLGEHPGADRLGAAHRAAEITGATVLLKGPVTVVATPGRLPFVIDLGSRRLATAGTGDVLTGIIAALLAHGLDAHRAAATGAWLHAAAAVVAGERLVAHELVAALPRVLDDTSATR